MFFKVAFKNEIHVLSAQKGVNFGKLTEFIASAFKRVPKKYQITYQDGDGDTICLFNDLDMKILMESGMKKVRLEIQEANEDFYDVTQEIQVSNVEEEKKQEEVEPTLAKEEPVDINSIPSNAQSLESSIQEKLSQVMAGLTKKIKQEILSENRVFEKTEEKEEKQEKEVLPENVHKYYICDECGCDPIVGVRYKCAVCADFDLCEKCQVTSVHQHPFLKIKNIRQTPMKIITILDSEEESLQMNGQKVALNGISDCLNAFGRMYQGAGGRCPRSTESKCPYMAKKEAGGKCPYMAKCEQKAEGGHPKVGPLNEVGLKFKEAGGKCPYMAKCEQKAEGEHPKVGPLNEVGLKFKEAGGKCPYMAKCEQKTQEKPEIQIEKVEEIKVQEVKEEPKKDQPEIEEEEPILILGKRQQTKTEQDTLIENANYLAELVEIDFNAAMHFTRNYSNLSKEDLLMKYLGQ